MSEHADADRAGAADGRDVVGVLLAAGGGRRYGMPKILAHQGRWLAGAVEALYVGGCDRVVVTVGAAQPTLPDSVIAVVVPDWSQGLSASVRAGVTAAVGYPDVAGVLLHVVDTPDVGAQVCRRILDVADARRSALVRAVYSGVPGHPVYIGVDHVPSVLAAVSGDRGAGPYLAADPHTIAVECGDLATGVDHDLPDCR